MSAEVKVTPERVHHGVVASCGRLKSWGRIPIHALQYLLERALREGAADDIVAAVKAAIVSELNVEVIESNDVPGWFCAKSNAMGEPACDASKWHAQAKLLAIAHAAATGAQAEAFVMTALCEKLGAQMGVAK